WDCANSGTSIQIAVIDSLTGALWKDEYPGDFGSIQCKAGFRAYYFYNTIWYPYNDGLKTFLLDTIPDGNYILIMSMNDMKVYNWDSSMKQIFTDLGLTKIQTITSAK